MFTIVHKGQKLTVEQLEAIQPTIEISFSSHWIGSQEEFVEDCEKDMEDAGCPFVLKDNDGEE